MLPNTHCLLTPEDLVDLLHYLGREHEFYKRALEALRETIDPQLQKYRDAAMRSSRDGEIEIDPGAVVSKGEDAGAYVMAWLWIADDELAP